MKGNLLRIDLDERDQNMMVLRHDRLEIHFFSPTKYDPSDHGII